MPARSSGGLLASAGNAASAGTTGAADPEPVATGAGVSLDLPHPPTRASAITTVRIMRGRYCTSSVPRAYRPSRGLDPHPWTDRRRHFAGFGLVRGMLP